MSEDDLRFMEIYDSMKAVVPAESDILTVIKASAFLIADCIERTGMSEENRDDTYPLIIKYVKQFVKYLDYENEVFG